MRGPRRVRHSSQGLLRPCRCSPQRGVGPRIQSLVRRPGGMPGRVWARRPARGSRRSVHASPELGRRQDPRGTHSRACPGPTPGEGVDCRWALGLRARPCPGTCQPMRVRPSPPSTPPLPLLAYMSSTRRDSVGPAGPLWELGGGLLRLCFHPVLCPRTWTRCCDITAAPDDCGRGRGQPPFGNPCLTKSCKPLHLTRRWAVGGGVWPPLLKFKLGWPRGCLARGGGEVCVCSGGSVRAVVQCSGGGVCVVVGEGGGRPAAAEADGGL